MLSLTRVVSTGSGVRGPAVPGSGADGWSNTHARKGYREIEKSALTIISPKKRINDTDRSRFRTRTGG